MEEWSRESLRRLSEENLRAMEVYSWLLNREGALFSGQEVLAFAKDCGMQPEDAFLALIAAACGLEPDRRPEDRRFLSRYLSPVLKARDIQAYRSNPYLERISFPNARMAHWQWTRQTYAPYQLFPCGNTVLTADGREIAPLGYFQEAFSYPAVLENGREWMTVTPNEIETMAAPLASARGKTAVLGLGLGYFAFMAAAKEEVSSVTVIERDSNAIALFQDRLLPQFPGRHKIRLLHGDAFDYLDRGMDKECYDFAFLDLWHDVSDGLPLYLKLRKMERRFSQTDFSYWIEDSMLVFLRSLFLDDWLTEAGRLDRLLRNDLLLSDRFSLPAVRRLTTEIQMEDIK